MKENQTIEYKESWRDEYLKWICGFANAQGGVLMIGKNDRGQTVGIRNARKLLEDLPNKIRDLLGIVTEVNLSSDGGRDLLKIKVEPHSYPINYRGKYYIRSGSTLQELANVFFRAGEIEAWGRGIQRMFEACRFAETPEPLIRYETNDLWIEFPFAESYLAVLGKVGLAETPVKTPVKTPEQILGLLRENPSMTLAEAARKIGKSLSAVERASSKLVKNGQLKYIGPKKGGHWEVKTKS